MIATPSPTLHTPDDALVLLRNLGAQERLVTHAQLVGEAADEILAYLATLGLVIDGRLVRLGAALHDAGKILHPNELEQPGAQHEPDGETLLLEHGVDSAVAHCCRSHAQWAKIDCSLEELLVALADKLWKGVRVPTLEERVIDGVAKRLGVDRWDIFVEMDTAFEGIAAKGAKRLLRSR